MCATEGRLSMWIIPCFRPTMSTKSTVFACPSLPPPRWTVRTGISRLLFPCAPYSRVLWIRSATFFFGLRASFSILRSRRSSAARRRSSSWRFRAWAGVSPSRSAVMCSMLRLLWYVVMLSSNALTSLWKFSGLHVWAPRSSGLRALSCEVLFPNLRFGFPGASGLPALRALVSSLTWSSLREFSRTVHGESECVRPKRVSGPGLLGEPAVAARCSSSLGSCCLFLTGLSGVVLLAASSALPANGKPLPSVVAALFTSGVPSLAREAGRLAPMISVAVCDRRPVAGRGACQGTTSMAGALRRRPRA
mmetsp:Transcript_88444/g.191483  ORF Transcript_88444/g.191483 Transcript_88444/m.191483 type:complete len:306 (-) Transcript_88444:82-999(-)